MTAGFGGWRRDRIEYEEGVDSYHVAWEDSELVSTNVVLSVAALAGVDPTDLPPLAETVDPGALNRIFSPSSEVTGSVSFEYAGYDVTVSADGTLEITPERDTVHRKQRRN